MIDIRKQPAGGPVHTSAFIGEVDDTLSVKVQVNKLTTFEVDAYGFLKPNVPLKIDGSLLNGTAGEYVYGVTVEATRLVDRNPSNASLLADGRTLPVIVCVIGLVNRAIARDVLGRPYTAAEIAGFAAAGSKLTLTRL